jgi:radical SAM protein with 4Fe4S-binding SPASM domain
MIRYHARPFTLHEFKVEVTHRCELNCIHCSSDARPSNLTEMSREECLSTLSQAVQIGAKDVAFSGGEPLIWRHIDDAVETAAARGLQVTIYTSGNCGFFKEKAERILRLGAYRFIFSMFGASAGSHEAITRSTGSFERTLEAMADAKKIGLRTEVHFVPMSNNYRELSGVAMLSSKLGASVVSVLRLVPHGRATLLRGRILTRVQNLDLRRLIRDLRNSGFNIRTGSPYNFLMLTANPECCAGIDRIIIGPELRLSPCDAFKQVKAEDLVGTLDYSTLREFSLRDCWDKSPYLEAIREYLTTPFPKPCASCRLLEKCLSGCLAQKVVTHGDLGKRPDPDCLGLDFRGGPSW